MSKKWVFSFVCFVIATLVCIALFNRTVDASNQFHDGQLQKAAQLVASGSNVLGFLNFDERTYQRELILRYKGKVGTIAVGSSRLLKVRSEHVPYPKPYLNHAMSGSTLEDCMAVVGIYMKEKGYVPGCVVLGVDPWYFNENSGMMEWKSLEEYVHYVSAEQGRKIAFPAHAGFMKYANLLSFRYTKENVKRFFSGARESVRATEELDVEHVIRRKDNSMEPPLSKRAPIPESEIPAMVDAMMAQSVYAMENFHRLYHIKMFEDFLDYLNGVGVAVVIYLPPFVRLAYQRMAADSRYAIITGAEALVREIAARKGLEVVGSFDPERCGIEDSDFSDLIHGRAIMSAKLLGRRG
ncbi:hypothetical protein [Desulfocurvus sp. DL9XJH121]